MSDAGVDLATLPGVRRHVRAVGSSLRAGRSCAWFLPAALGIEHRLDVLLDLLSTVVPLRIVEPGPPPLPRAVELESASTSTSTSTSTSIGEPAESGSIDALMGSFFAGAPVVAVAPGRRVGPTPLAERALRAAYAFGCIPDPDAPPSRDPIVLLAGLVFPGGVTLVIRGESEAEAELTDLMHRYPVVARDHTDRRPENRPVLLAVGSPAALSNLVRPDPLIADAFWWWGVHTRLDMLTAATAIDRIDPPTERRARWDELCPDLAPEVIAEVAAPDVEFAAHLAAVWDGTHEHLAKEVTGLVGPDDASGLGRADIGRLAGARPASRLWDHWSAGHVGVWNGVVRGTPLCGSPELAERVWIGQARALQPVLDRWRRTLVAEVLSASQPAALERLDREYCSGHTVAAIELNVLRNAVRDRVVTLETRSRRLLDEVVGARNDLAHRRMIDEARLDRLHLLTSDS